MKTEFINIDMVLHSQENLSPIVDELKRQIFILQNAFDENEYKLAFECVLEGSQVAPVVDTFINLLDTLSPQAKALFVRCGYKVLDIGYNSGSTAILYDSIHAKQLKKLSEYGLDLKITIYPLDLSIK